MPKRKASNALDATENIPSTSADQIPVNTPQFSGLPSPSNVQMNDLTLGHDWGYWYQFNTDFLSKIPPQSSLKIETCEEYIKAIYEASKGSSVMFNVGFANASNYRERDDIIKLLQSTNMLKNLSIKHTSSEKFPMSVKVNDTEKIVTCSSSLANFLQAAIHPFSLTNTLEELELQIICNCVCNNNDNTHGQRDVPLLAKEHILAIAQCSSLKKLSILQGITAEACIHIGNHLKNITQLVLDDTSKITDEALMSLKCLPLEALTLRAEPFASINFTPDGLLQLFQGSFADKLAKLSLILSMYWGADQNRSAQVINEVLKATTNLIHLELAIETNQHPVINHLSKLDTFSYLCPQNWNDRQIQMGMSAGAKRNGSHPLIQLTSLKHITIAKVLLPEMNQLALTSLSNVKSLNITGYRNCCTTMYMKKLLENCKNLSKINLGPLRCLRDIGMGIDETLLPMLAHEKNHLKSICKALAKMPLEEITISNLNDFDWKICQFSLFNMTGSIEVRPFPLNYTKNYFISQLGQWKNLKTLSLSFAVGFAPKWFDLICSKLSLLESLEISADAPMNYVAVNWEEDPQPSNLNLLLLEQLPRLVKFEYVASYSSAPQLFRELFWKCNSVFSIDKDGDRMSKWPNMKQFLIKDCLRESGFVYIIRKTGLGEIKRFLQMVTLGSIPDPKNLISVALDPQHVCQNTLPPNCHYPQVESEEDSECEEEDLECDEEDLNADSEDNVEGLDFDDE